MAEVIVSESETFEAALRRFSKKVQQDGILAEARRREHYETPSVRRKKKESGQTSQEQEVIDGARLP